VIRIEELLAADARWPSPNGPMNPYNPDQITVEGAVTHKVGEWEQLTATIWIIRKNPKIKFRFQILNANKRDLAYMDDIKVHREEQK